MLSIIVPSSGSSCTGCINQTKLSYYAYSGAVNVGACGYGSFAAKLYGGNVAAASSDLYRNGVGCSACYQIRCTDPKLCNKSGATIVVADFTRNNQTDFVVSRSTFSSLAIAKKGPRLLKSGIIDIEYKRVPCEYKGQNMVVKVDESSQYPYYLAVQFLYQGGQTEIVNVDVAQVGTSEWHYMTRNHGAVWDIEKPPGGALQFRFVVTSGYDGKWLWAKKSVLPSDWKSGGVYDTGIQISDVARDICNACDDNDSAWAESP
jgi:hypothetical protein